jgi:hypothetical protein
MWLIAPLDYTYLSIYWSTTSGVNFRISLVKGTLGPFYSLYALTLLLGCLSLLKVVHVTETRGTTFFRRANILASRSSTAGDATTATPKYFLRVIIGTRLWKRTLPYVKPLFQNYHSNATLNFPVTKRRGSMDCSLTGFMCSGCDP